jgi:AraC-like DNA-binding protein
LAHLVVFQPEARVRARLRDALGTVHQVSTADSWRALAAFVAREQVDGCVVDADYPTREQALTKIRALRESHPALALAVYADVDETDLELYRFGGLGVDGVVLARRPPWASTIRDAVERSLATARASRVGADLAGRYEASAVRAVSWAVEHAGRCLSVSEFAAALGHTPRSLGELLRSNGLPPANRLLVWGRLLLAGACLGEDGRTVEETAFRLGYSTATALSRAMKREVGRTPTEVARLGGLASVQSRIFPRRRTRRRTRLGKGLRCVALIAAAAIGSSGCATARGGRGEVFSVDPVGVDSLDIASRDASGRSSADLVTPRAGQRILRYRVFGKTGTIANVNSPSGNLVGSDDREVVFSILFNGSGLQSGRVRAAIDDVATALAGSHP